MGTQMRLVSKKNSIQRKEPNSKMSKVQMLSRAVSSSTPKPSRLSFSWLRNISSEGEGTRKTMSKQQNYTVNWQRMTTRTQWQCWECATSRVKEFHWTEKEPEFSFKTQTKFPSLKLCFWSWTILKFRARGIAPMPSKG